MKIGIDLGGTNVRAGLVDPTGRVVARDSVPTRAERGVDAVVAEIADLCRRVAGRRWTKVKGCGIGAPGPLDLKRTVIEFAPNLGWRDVELGRLLRRRIRKPVRLENDANCAAVGEHFAGAGKGADSVALWTLGTGVGGGLVLGGKLWIGASGGAGEFGHMLAERDGRLCGCGRRGCVEAYASATAMGKRYKELTGRAANPKELFESDDLLAARVIDEATTALAIGVVNVVHALHPECAILGGGIAAAGQRLLRPVKEKVLARVFPSFAKSLRIVLAALGDDAGIVGAAVLAG